ncbi:MAG: hypothetical protein R3D45_02420 [Rhizobiaceae bacterium]
MDKKAATFGSSAFALGILKFLDRVEYRRCDRGEDFEAICRLRYKAYESSGLLPPGGPKKISDDLDFKPNCHNFSIHVDGMLVSTLRIHHLTGERPWGPSMAVYEDVVAPRLAAGEHFIDPSRFASDPDWSTQMPEIPYITLRLAGMACMYFDAPFCLSTIRPEHSAFYRRVYGSRQIGELRNYPRFTRKVGLYQADVEAIRERSFVRYPFFKSTAVEQRLLFDRPSAGADAPLTVLPTARSLRDAA